MTVGCLLAGGGILLASAVLGPNVDFSTLGWVLPIAGIGLGMLLVPVTSVPLTVVPPERSGMAASATNTSREMGAVFGVAILGSIVNAKLTGDLAARLKAIGIPPNFQSLVEHAIQTGGTSGGAASSAEHSNNATVARIANKVINAAYDAFGSGLHEALVVSGVPHPGRRRRGGVHHPPAFSERGSRALACDRTGVGGPAALVASSSESLGHLERLRAVATSEEDGVDQ